MDYPTAWEISRSVDPEDHDERCSTALTDGMILCDCAVLTKHPQYLADYGDLGPAIDQEAT